MVTVEWDKMSIRFFLVWSTSMQTRIWLLTPLPFPLYALEDLLDFERRRRYVDDICCASSTLFGCRRRFSTQRNTKCERVSRLIEGRVKCFRVPTCSRGRSASAVWKSIGRQVTKRRNFMVIGVPLYGRVWWWSIDPLIFVMNAQFKRRREAVGAANFGRASHIFSALCF